jgi:excisionase family DNA binding protein
MSAPDRVLGRAEAILEVVQSSMSEVQRSRERSDSLTSRLEQTLPDVEALRSIVPEIEDIIRDAKGVEWMTSTEIATHLKAHPDTVRRWYRKGIIPGYRVGEGDDIRFDRTEVDRAIRGLPTQHVEGFGV